MIRNCIMLDGIVYNCDHISEVRCAGDSIQVTFINKRDIYLDKFEDPADRDYYFEQLQKYLVGYVGDRGVEWREHAKRKRETLAAAEKGV